MCKVIMFYFFSLLPCISYASSNIENVSQALGTRNIVRKTTTVIKTTFITDITFHVFILSGDRIVRNVCSIL